MLNLELRRGDRVALVGPNGAGKSTLLKLLAGVLQFEKGERKLGHNVTQAYYAQHQLDLLNPNHTALDEITLAAPMEEQPFLRAILGRFLFSGDDAKKKVSVLSGGEKSRVGLGRALLSSPDILLLDEPLAALDAQRRQEILPYLEKLRDEARLPMLYVSHALDEVARLAHQIVILKDGHVARQGSVFDVLSDIELPAFAGSLGAVIETIIGRRRADGLSGLDFDGCTLLVQELNRPQGTVLRVRIRAEEIMLALEEPRTISANNVLLMSVLGVRHDSATHADVQLLCGRTRLVARITRASLERLALAAGKPVFAIIKSVTVDTQMTPQID